MALEGPLYLSAYLQGHIYGRLQLSCVQQHLIHRQDRQQGGKLLNIARIAPQECLRGLLTRNQNLPFRSAYGLALGKDIKQSGLARATADTSFHQKKQLTMSNNAQFQYWYKAHMTPGLGLEYVVTEATVTVKKWTLPDHTSMATQEKCVCSIMLLGCKVWNCAHAGCGCSIF